MTRARSKVLIIDDEEDMCWALENIMKRQGVSSRSVVCGQDALELVRKFSFGLIYLDVKLPDIEGIELAQQIRGIDRKVPIVLVSGFFYHDDVPVQTALQDKLISCFISKPFQHNEIVGSLKFARRRLN